MRRVRKDEKGDNHMVSKMAKYAVWLVEMNIGRNGT